MPPDKEERRPQDKDGAQDDAPGGGNVPASITGATVNDWIYVVRRAHLGATVKLVALVVASYANPDGTKVFPGVTRLAVQCEIDYRTARRALAALRSQGLIEMVRRGARRAGKSDEYRLILADDLLERCDVPTPAAERVAIERMADRQRHPKPSSTGHPRPIEPGSTSDFYRSPETHENSSTGQTAHVLQGTGDPPPSIDLYREKQSPSDETDLRNGGHRRGPPGAEGDGKVVAEVEGEQPDPRTPEGTEQIRRREADRLTAWLREHPEYEATP